MKPWETTQVDDQVAAHLARVLDLHAVTARCLVGRGLREPGTAHAFLNPKLAALRPPKGLWGFETAVGALRDAVLAGHKIGVFGDYDVDGVTSAALLGGYLQELGASVEIRVASRDRGYGFTGADAAALEQAGCRLVVTTDCGTSDRDVIADLAARGVPTVVVDHHQVPDRPDHPALALLNPHHPASTYPYRGFASVGLCFYVVSVLRTTLAQAGFAAPGGGLPDPKEWLDLVAVGTVADMAPLTEENRILVSVGLGVLSERKRPGLNALLSYAGVERGRPLTEVDIGWKIGPRLNAPGRLGDAAVALGVVSARDPAQAMAFAAACEEANQLRRTLQESILQQALIDAAGQAEHSVIVVGRTGWHPGVTGIVANKLTEEFGKPAVVVALEPEQGRGRGSVRSPGGLHIVELLKECEAQLVRYGGHAEAGGFTVAADGVEAFGVAFRQAVARAAPRPAVARMVDAVVAWQDIDVRLARELGALAPFGPGNPEPVVSAAGVRVTQAKPVGSDKSHLKLTLDDGAGRPLSAIAFRMASRAPVLGARIDLACRPELSSFRGQTRLELRVLDLRLAREPDTAL